MVFGRFGIGRVLAVLAVGCGGSLVQPLPDAGTDKVPGPEKPVVHPPVIAMAMDAAPLPPPAGSSRPVMAMMTDASPPQMMVTVVDAQTPPPSADASVVSTRPTIDCSKMVATGPPPSVCGTDDACPAGLPYEGYAEDLLACLTDKCLTDQGRAPWCGDIMLGIGANGCLQDYSESTSAGGCVKYQGAYRKWTCMAGKQIRVSRPCGK